MSKTIDFFKRQIGTIGAVLILLSVGWQVLLEDVAKSIELDTRFYQVNEKLDYLWIYSGYVGQKYLDEFPLTSSNYGTLDNMWNQLGDVHKKVRDQADFFGNIRAWIFVIGSVLLLFAQYRRNEIELRALG